MQKPLISLIVPLHNEADSILELHRQILVALKELPHEVIFVNDGSNDQTLNRLMQIKAPVSILNTSKRSGQSAALLAGICHAKGSYIVTLDGDLQNDPKDIPSMLRLIQSTAADMVIGNRSIRHDSLLKKIPSKSLNLILKYALNLPFSDMGCGLKVMTKELALSLPLQPGMHRFLPLTAHRLGVKVVETKINHRPRIHGTSKYNLKRIPKVIIDLFFIFFDKRLTKSTVNYSFELIK